MNTKSSYLFENNNPKVEELRFYLRWSKRLFFALVAVVVVNLILTYGLIFHPSKPSVSTCARYCPQIHIREVIDASPGFTTSLSPPINEVIVNEESTTTAVATRSPSEINARFDYGSVKTGVALAMAGYWVTNQAIQWWNMVSACQEFGSNASNGINCLWGAVSTVITAAGTMYGAYVGVGRIQTWMNNNGITIGGFKRDEVDQELLDELSKVFGVDVAHLGVWDYSHLELGGTLSTRDASAPLDVFGFTSQSGADMHFSYLGNTTNGLSFKFGWGTGNSNTKVKDRAESFDQQYFSSGGIDFIISQNQEDGGKLDSYSDYWWMYDQVACIMSPAMTAAGHWFQIYDNVQRGTIAEGAVAPFRGSDHWSAISVMNNEPTPLLTNSACEKRKERAVEFEA